VTLVLLSVAGGARLVAASDHTAPVVALARDAAAGTVLERGDVVLVRAQLPAGARSRYLADPEFAIGRRLDRPLGAGELLPAIALRVVDASATVVIPLQPDAAPGLVAGERISVWVSAAGCSPRLLLGNVPVQGVHSNRSAAFSTAGGQTVLVRLPAALADRVISALAIKDVVLRAARLDGASEPVTLPDLGPCQATR
jgi:hypothetical protein